MLRADIHLESNVVRLSPARGYDWQFYDGKITMGVETDALLKELNGRTILLAGYALICCTGIIEQSSVFAYCLTGQGFSRPHLSRMFLRKVYVCRNCGRVISTGIAGRLFAGDSYCGFISAVKTRQQKHSWFGTFDDHCRHRWIEAYEDNRYPGILRFEDEQSFFVFAFWLGLGSARNKICCPLRLKQISVASTAEDSIYHLLNRHIAEYTLSIFSPKNDTRKSSAIKHIKSLLEID